MAEKSKYQDIDAVDAALDKGVAASTAIGDSSSGLTKKVADLELNLYGWDSFEEKLGWMQDNGTFNTTNNGYFIPINVYSGQKVVIKSNNEYLSLCAFVKSYNDSSFVYATGYSSRYRVNIGTTSDTITIPSDCKYILVASRLGDNIYKPADVVIDGKSILESFDYKINSLSSVSSKVYSPSVGNISLQNGRIRWKDGTIESNTTFKYATINVEGGNIVSFYSCSVGNGGAYGVAFYDNDDKYVGGFYISHDEKYTNVVAPIQARKMRYSFNATYWSDEKYNTFVVSNGYSKGYAISVMRGGCFDLETLKWNAVGDSITEQQLYMKYIKDNLHLSYENYGVGGSTIAVNNTYLQNQSIVERVCGLNGNTAIEDADIWTLYGGLNDMHYNTPVGSLAIAGSDFDITTLYGALQKIVEYILGLKPFQKLVLITPHHTQRDNVSPSEKPTTMAIVREAITKVGEYYGVPVLDLHSKCYINEKNLMDATNPTTTDGVHPTSYGGALIGKVVSKTITEQFIYEDVKP